MNAKADKVVAKIKCFVIIVVSDFFYMLILSSADSRKREPRVILARQEKSDSSPYSGSSFTADEPVG